MDDIDIDLEDLEVMLYSQVFHGSANENDLNDTMNNYQNAEVPPSKYDSLPNVFNIPNMIYNSRYYDPNRRNYSNQQFYGNSFPTNFQPSTSQINDRDCRNFDNINQRNQVTLQPLYMQPPVNNIVFLPPPPTQIITSDITSKRRYKNLKFWEKKQQQRLDKRKRKKERRAKRKLEKCNISDSVINTNEGNVVSCDDDDDNDSVQILDIPEEIISISDDEEINKSMNCISSDEENMLKTAESSVAIVTDKNDEDRKPNIKENVNLVVESKIDEDEDVIYVEPDPKLNEVINLDPDDLRKDIIKITEPLEDQNSNKTSPTKLSNKFNKNMITPKERKEMLSTPESTTSNDFLEIADNLDIQQTNFNFSLHGSDFVPTTATASEFLRPKTPADNEIYETESSCSASDVNVTPVKEPVFQEIEFESPKDLFKGNNLENFGNYIVPKRNGTPNIQSILTPTCSFNVNEPLTNKRDKFKRNIVENESDSSSESEYDIQISTPKKIANVKNMSALSKLSPIPNVYEDVNKVNKKTNSAKTQKTEENASLPENPLKRNSDSQSNNNGKKSKKENLEVVAGCSKEIASTNRIISSDVIALDEDTNSSNSTIYMMSDLTNLKTNLNLVNCDLSQPRAEVKNTYKPRRFSDYWTTDMKKFYTQNWDLENFTLEKVQANMSDDPTKWKILDADCGHLKYESPKGRRCHLCHQRGHFSMKCPNRTKPIKCSLCGGYNHMEPRCPNKICTQCGAKGDYSTIYCKYCIHERRAKCSICQRRGHVKTRCPDLWRRYHNMTTENAPTAIKGAQLIPQKKRWCSGCGANGHFGLSCPRYGPHPPVDPCVKSYKDVYGFNRIQEPKHTDGNIVSDPKASNSNNEKAETSKGNKEPENIDQPTTRSQNIFIKFNNTNSIENNQQFSNNREFYYQQPRQQTSQAINPAFFQQKPAIFQFPNINPYMPFENDTAPSAQFNNPRVEFNFESLNTENLEKARKITISYVHARFLLEEPPGIDFLHDLYNEIDVEVKIDLQGSSRKCEIILIGNNNNIKLAKTFLDDYLLNEISNYLIPCFSKQFVQFFRGICSKIAKDKNALNRLKSFENELKHCTKPEKRLYYKKKIRQQTFLINKRYLQCPRPEVKNHMNTLENIYNYFLQESGNFQISYIQMEKIKESFYEVFYKRKTTKEYSHISFKTGKCLC